MRKTEQVEGLVKIASSSLYARLTHGVNAEALGFNLKEVLPPRCEDADASKVDDVVDTS